MTKKTYPFKPSDCGDLERTTITLSKGTLEQLKIEKTTHESAMDALSSSALDQTKTMIDPNDNNGLIVTVKVDTDHHSYYVIVDVTPKEEHKRKVVYFEMNVLSEEEYGKFSNETNHMLIQ